MTRLEAAHARAEEAKQAEIDLDWHAAARDWTLAAEQFDAIWHEMHGHSAASPDAYNARSRARQAIAKRDAERAVADAEGRALDEQTDAAEARANRAVLHAIADMIAARLNRRL